MVAAQLHTVPCSPTSGSAPWHCLAPVSTARADQDRVSISSWHFIVVRLCVWSAIGVQLALQTHNASTVWFFYSNVVVLDLSIYDTYETAAVVTRTDWLAACTTAVCRQWLPT